MKFKEYKIKNEFLEASFINLGATITSLVYLPTNTNVIVGHNNLETYEKENIGHMNSIIGRNSGRITDFMLSGKKYYPAREEGKLTQLHGGKNGIERKYFAAEVGNDYIKFTTTSIDGEEGYPGNLNLSVTYKLLGTEIQIIYDAVSDKKTLMSFTNHAYFNLNGNIEESILNHELYLNADQFLLADKNMLSYKAVTVEGTPMDFKTAKIVGKDINSPFAQLELTKGFDHPYLVKGHLDNRQKEIRHAAYLKSPKTNLILDIYSTEDAIVLYTGNSMNEAMILNNGIKGYKHAALCLESEGIPNSPNIKEFKNRSIYMASERYSQVTIWKITHQA